MEPTLKNKKVGVLIMLLGAIGFFSTFMLFGQAGTTIDYRNPVYMLKTAVTDGFLVAGLYFGLRFYAGKKIGSQVGGAVALLMLLAYVVGLISHR